MTFTPMWRLMSFTSPFAKFATNYEADGPLPKGTHPAKVPTELYVSNPNF